MNSGYFPSWHVPLITYSQIHSTFQDGGRVKFPTPGIVVNVKIPTHMRFTKSNSPGLPDPPILGQTNDRCIMKTSSLKVPTSLQSNFIIQIGVITVFDTILTGRQSGQKLQCLYGSQIANNFFQN